MAMGHSIPVFLIPITKDEVPIKLEHWNDAEKLISKKYENKIENKLYSITSRNWWVQHALSLICNDIRITGLEFIMKEIIFISGEELIEAGQAFEKLLKLISNGIPKLKSDSEKEGSIWGLRKYFIKGKEGTYSNRDINSAYIKAIIVPDLHVSDSGYQSVVDFFSSIKTYHNMVNYCIQNNKGLLIVQP
jgi:hypothetical protein